MKNFIDRAIAEVQSAEWKRITLTPAQDGWHAQAKANMRVFIIMKAYILGNEKAYLSSNLDGAPIYEVTYDSNRECIYFVTYVQTAKETIILGGEK